MSNAMQTVTITDLVYRRLRDEIISGKLEPSSRIIESNLAERYSVSRTPLREAVKRLEQERLVERLPQGGVLVAPISYQEATEYNQIRAALEGLMARLAAAKVERGALSESDGMLLEKLRATLREMQLQLRLNDYQALLDRGFDFHRTLHQLAGNDRCAVLLSQIMDSMQRYRVMISQERQARVVEEHRAVATAVLDGDPVAAEKLMLEHVLAAEAVYSSSIDAILAGRRDSAVANDSEQH